MSDLLVLERSLWREESCVKGSLKLYPPAGADRMVRGEGAGGARASWGVRKGIIVSLCSTEM